MEQSHQSTVAHPAPMSPVPPPGPGGSTLPPHSGLASPDTQYAPRLPRSELRSTMRPARQLQAPWLVVDTRTTQSGINSGIGRFVVSFCRALTDVLAAGWDAWEARAHEAGGTAAEMPPLPIGRVLLVGKAEPPAWVVELVSRYPGTVSYWSGGPGALSRRWERPIYFWSTRVLGRIAAHTQGNYYWLAPANFDRPMMLGALRGGLPRQRIIQFIQDTIPLTQGKSMGFLFRCQFKFFVGRTLARFPLVFTSSQHTAQKLSLCSPKRPYPICVLPFGVEPSFGAEPRMSLPSEKEQARRTILCTLHPELTQPEAREHLESLVRRAWVVGVGRYQKYKGWEVAEEAVSACSHTLPHGALFVRVGFEMRDLQRFPKGELKPFGASGALFHPGVPFLGLAGLSDQALALLYRAADCLVHPSQAEGFGFPPLEAVLCGLPVLFRDGTAVADHFAPGTLPEELWRAVDSDAPSDWAAAISQTVQAWSAPSPSVARLLADLGRFPNTRAYFEHVSRGTQFSWHEAARLFLQQLHSQANAGSPGLMPAAARETEVHSTPTGEP